MKDKWSAEKIQSVARGFSRARVLLSAVELDIFTLLDTKPLTVSEIAGRLNSDTRATTILLDALAAMELIVKSDGQYHTNPEVRDLLTAGSPGSVLPGLMHSAHLWKTWSQLTEVVREGGPAAGSEGSGTEEHLRAFIGAMHVGALRSAPEVIQDVDPGTAGKLLDVGGGSGSYTIGFLRTCPGMKATLFDLPDVIPMARERISSEGLTDRVTFVAGSYNGDELPPGHDLAFLSAIIHQNSPDENMSLYSKVYRALKPGGRVIIRDYVLNDDRTRPASGALFAVNMLINTQGGNSYTFEEIRKGLEAAGFEQVRLLQEKEMSSLVEGWKP